MEEDVNKAIKQLESIAIKAMKSGYLDDAAKVMHIAEEIERVDKSGVVPESSDDAELVTESAATPESVIEAAADEEGAAEPQEGSANVVALNTFRMKRGSSVQSKQKDTPSSQR